MFNPIKGKGTPPPGWLSERWHRQSEMTTNFSDSFSIKPPALAMAKGVLCYEDVYPKNRLWNAGTLSSSAAINFDFWFRFPLLQSTAFHSFSLGLMNKFFPSWLNIAEFSLPVFPQATIFPAIFHQSFEVLLNVVKSVPAFEESSVFRFMKAKKKKKEI